MTVTISTSDLLSVQHAAQELKLPRSTLYRRIDAGKIFAIRLGGVLFVPKSEIERLQAGGEGNK